MKEETYLEKLGIKELNEMQVQTIELLSREQKLLLLSETGSGKTLAYLLPLLNSIQNNEITQALIIAPSRELVLQIESVIKLVQNQLKVSACYGGHKREIEENNLLQAPSVIIATPGRLGDHIRRKNVDLSKLHFLVMDEFDKCLELGFTEEISFIFQSIDPSKLKMVFTSATNLAVIPEFTQMLDAERLDFLPENPDAKKGLEVHTVWSQDKDKLKTLKDLLCFVKNTTSIVFCNHREAVERVSTYLNENKIHNVFYHGGMEQIDRETALAKFRNKSSDVLVTTDLASRGLDIAEIRNIIHYHLPLEESSFTHRNGRTARMNATGVIYVIYSSDEKLPPYIATVAEPLKLPEELSIPDKPKWTTLFIAAGKKNKINKIDIVGFLSQKGELKQDDIGLIEVKDFSSFVAVRKSRVPDVLELVKAEKIKNQKVKICVAK